MDMRLNTIERERAVFYGRLIREPLFLLRHLPAFFRFISLRMLSRIASGIGKCHKGAKRRPSWLPRPDGAGRQAPSLAQVIAAIPQNALPDNSEIRKYDVGYSTHQWGDGGDGGDREAFFYRNRFAWLFNVDPTGLHTDKTKKILEEWIHRHQDQCAPEWETYSCCERVGNLLGWLSLVPPELREKAAPANLPEFLARNGRWIMERVEYYGVRTTNNHIINNGRALVMLGRVLGNASLARVGMAILRYALPKMVGRDGMLRERSSHYQVVIFQWVLDAEMFLREFPFLEGELSFLNECANRMAKASAGLLNKEGFLLDYIGDISPDMTPHDSCRRLKMLHPKCFQGASDIVEPVMRWDDWVRINAGESVVLLNAPAGSYPPAFPTHGHTDLTSFSWIWRGRHILADAGRFRYLRDAVSERQRSAGGHNLLLVNGLAPICEGVRGDWAPTSYGGCTVTVATVPGKVVLSHNGFGRGGSLIQHTRSIHCLGEALTVEDSLTGAGQAIITLGWNFAPEWRYYSDSHILQGDLARIHRDVVLDGVNQGIFEMRWEKMELSESYGVVDYGSRLSYEAKVQLPCVVRTRFIIEPCAE